MDLVNDVYRITQNLPASENFTLTSQIRRSAISIPSNIAEGYKRRSLGEYIQFLGIAEGSSAELETQLYICKASYPKLDYAEALSLLTEVQKMLYALIQKLKQSTTTL